MSKIAVFGGNGFAGSAIAKEAASRGHEVTVVARSAQSGTDTNVVQGSVHDNTIVEQITADNDVVVVAIPAREIDGKRHEPLERAAHRAGSGGRVAEDDTASIIQTPGGASTARRSAAASPSCVLTLKRQAAGIRTAIGASGAMVAWRLRRGSSTASRARS